MKKILLLCMLTVFSLSTVCAQDHPNIYDFNIEIDDAGNKCKAFYHDGILIDQWVGDEDPYNIINYEEFTSHNAYIPPHAVVVKDNLPHLVPPEGYIGRETQYKNMLHSVDGLYYIDIITVKTNCGDEDYIYDVRLGHHTYFNDGIFGYYSGFGEPLYKSIKDDMYFNVDCRGPCIGASESVYDGVNWYYVNIFCPHTIEEQDKWLPLFNKFVDKLHAFNRHNNLRSFGIIGRDDYLNDQCLRKYNYSLYDNGFWNLDYEVLREKQLFS